MHFPDQYGLAKATHEEEYQKRHERLEERIKEMKKAEKKAAKEAEKQQTAEKTEKKVTAPKTEKPESGKAARSRTESMCRRQHPAHLFTTPQENRGQGRTTPPTPPP